MVPPRVRESCRPGRRRGGPVSHGGGRRRHRGGRDVDAAAHGCRVVRSCLPTAAGPGAGATEGIRRRRHGDAAAGVDAAASHDRLGSSRPFRRCRREDDSHRRVCRTPPGVRCSQHTSRCRRGRPGRVRRRIGRRHAAAAGVWGHVGRGHRSVRGIGGPGALVLSGRCNLGADRRCANRCVEGWRGRHGAPSGEHPYRCGGVGE
mmetsp:Transcript_40356/g.74711  ORF Transcript_40356/g.74711 Transcript_40356/m.74711 type:complete len:204 (-) Transcript_40356:427-1038(-)